MKKDCREIYLDYKRLSQFCEGKLTYLQFDEVINDIYCPTRLITDESYEYTVETLIEAILHYRDKDPNLFFDFYLRPILLCLYDKMQIDIGDAISYEGLEMTEYPKNDLHRIAEKYDYSIPVSEKQIVTYVMHKLVEKYLKIEFEYPGELKRDYYLSVYYYGMPYFQDDCLIEDEIDFDYREADIYELEKIDSEFMNEILDYGLSVINILMANLKTNCSNWNLTVYQSMNYIKRSVKWSVDYLCAVSEDDRMLIVKCLDTITNSINDNEFECYFDAFMLKAFLLWGIIPGYYEQDYELSVELLKKCHWMRTIMNSEVYISICMAIGLLYCFNEISLDSFSIYDNTLAGLNYLYEGQMVEKNLSFELNGYVYESQDKLYSRMECYLPVYFGTKYRWKQLNYVNMDWYPQSLSKSLYDRYKVLFLDNNYDTPFPDAALNMYLNFNKNEIEGFRYIMEAKEGFNKKWEGKEAQGNAIYEYIIDRFLINQIDKYLNLDKQ